MRNFSFACLATTSDHLDAEAVIVRETGPLLALCDNHPKTIITLDSVHGDSIEGIQVASLSNLLSERH